jgi:hypothetical protein
MTEPPISLRRANAMKPVIDAAMALQRAGKLVPGLMVKLEVSADALLEMLEALKDPMGRC